MQTGKLSYNGVGWGGVGVSGAVVGWAASRPMIPSYMSEMTVFQVGCTTNVGCFRTTDSVWN